MDTVSCYGIIPGILQDIDRVKILGQATLISVWTFFGYEFEDGSRLWLAPERFEPSNIHADWDTFILKMVHP